MAFIRGRRRMLGYRKPPAPVYVAPNIAYAGSPFTWLEDAAISDQTPVNTGGAITSYALQSGSLPTGISLNTSTGVLSGTPTAAYDSSFVIRATGPGGTDDFTVVVEVTADAAPEISYAFSPFTWIEDIAISTGSTTPLNTGGTITSYALQSGSLPAGISLNTSTGVLSGTPTAVYDSSFVIRATGPGGTDDFTVVVEVIAAGTAEITTLVSNVTRMAPCVVSAHAVATVLGAGDYHTARYQWEVIGPGGWTAPTCLDPRLGLQEGDTIDLGTDCEGFNFAFPADIAGSYTLRLTVTDEDGTVYTDEEVITVAADTRTIKYVSHNGSGGGDGSIGSPWRQPASAATYVNANGKTDFTILLEKGGTYDGFGNDSSGEYDWVNCYIGAYGTGADPILKWSTATYPTGSLLNLVGGEAIFVRGINFRGNDTDEALLVSGSHSAAANTLNVQGTIPANVPNSGLLRVWNGSAFLWVKYTARTSTSFTIANGVNSDYSDLPSLSGGEDIWTTIQAICIIVANEALNIGLMDLTFGGASNTDHPSYCVQTAATNNRTAVPPYQSRGLVFINCSGHSGQYFFFSDAPDTEGTVSDAGFANTATEFECSPTRLSTTDDVYNGMEITVGGGLGRNQRCTVSDYVGNTGSGKCKFTLTSPLKGVPTSGELLWVASIVDVGDSDIFFFGVENHATSGLGTEVRTRIINGTRMTAVGSVMDGSTDALQQKSGFRLMVDYCYLYRCAELNGGVQIGVDLGAGGIGPHTYMVMDRCYLACLDETSKGPFGFTSCSKVLVKACVCKGNLTAAQETNNLTTFNSEYNCGFPDVRILHCSMFMNVWANGVLISNGQGLAAGRTYWPAGFLTYENNLQIHGATEHYTDFIRDENLREDGGTGSSLASCVGNVFFPSTTYGGGYTFTKPGSPTAIDLTLSDLNAESFADNNWYGTMNADDLIAADYVPAGTNETTKRNTTSKGVFQDYYGRNPVGGTYSGAVGLAI